VHYRNLQLYKKHGLVITKVHKIISFTQSAWLRPWIELCNEQRRSAKSDFESDLAKLQANATFGKTMENVRNRVNIRLVTDPNKLLKAVSKVTFRQSQIVNSDLVMVRAARQKVKLDKPIAVGFSILEISKFKMYQFYYEHLKANTGTAAPYCLQTQTPSAVKYRPMTCTKTWGSTWTCTTPAFLPRPPPVFQGKPPRAGEDEERDGVGPTQRVRGLKGQNV